MLALTGVTVLLASLAQALPTNVNDVQQLVIGGVNGGGLDVVQQVKHAAMTNFGLDDSSLPHTMTRWDWVDCGKP